MLLGKMTICPLAIFRAVHKRDLFLAIFSTITCIVDHNPGQLHQRRPSVSSIVFAKSPLTPDPRVAATICTRSIPPPITSTVAAIQQLPVTQAI
jgi:hypothetical protein